MQFFIKKDYKNYKFKNVRSWIPNFYDKIRFIIVHYFRNYKNNNKITLNSLLRKLDINQKEILQIEAHIKNCFNNA